MWLAIISICLLHICTISHGPRWLFYVTKPLPIALLAYLVLTHPTHIEHYSAVIGFGLILSLVGDIFLMQPIDRFRAGLCCFLIAQLSYGYAFSLTFSQYTSLWLPVSLFALGITVYLMLLPNMKGEKWYVGLYFISIIFMTWNAMQAWQTSMLNSTVLIGIAAIIFIMSDLVLAIDRFRTSSDFSRHVVMFTYYTAQSLIALSAIWMI